MKQRTREPKRSNKKRRKKKELEEKKRYQRRKRIRHKEVNLNPSGDEDDPEYPICGLLYKDDESGDSWICCDKCNDWFCFKCSGLDDVNDDFC